MSKTTNRELFKEAIADAKAVKEMAIANAKAALEESFTPHLKSMLSAKLQEMENESENPVDETKIEEAEIDENIEEVEETKEVAEVKKDEDEDLNLDEILAELNEETEESDETVNEAKKDEPKGEKDEEVDVESMSEGDLKSFIEDVIKDMVAAGELEAGTEGGVEVDDEEVNIDEILSSLSEESEKAGVKGFKKIKSFGMDADDADDEYVTPKSQEKVPALNSKEATKVSNFEAKLEEKEEELYEAIKTINKLRSEINEVNLLNSKLLYTNKIFKSKNLSESQKIKVLNSFDKAKTVKESKLVFETLIEGLKEKKSNLTLENLGRASKSTGVSTAKKPILEVNELKNRFQKLAGII